MLVSLLFIYYHFQAYFHNMKPADYGTSYEAMNEITNRNRMKDPLFNKGLITNNPTPRQEQILSQLASLKQVSLARSVFFCLSISLEKSSHLLGSF